MNRILNAHGSFAQQPRTRLAVAACLAVLLVASQAWRWASPTSVVLIFAASGALLVLRKPELGLMGLIFVALLANMEFATGTEVKLNPATLLVPLLAVLWLLNAMGQRQARFVSSRSNLPLVLFLASGLISLLVGRATWDPAVPVSSNFLLVQLAQWAIFAFSAVAFWLAASLVRNETSLQRLTYVFLLVGGLLAILIAIFGAGAVVGRISTAATYRAPFWILLTGLAGGQLLFNNTLSSRMRVFLIVVSLCVVAYAFVVERASVSNWVGVASTAGVLVWLRWPRLRLPFAVIIAALIVIGVLVPSIYQFAGGDEEWTGSGASRLVLIERVIDVTLRNPITGLGPAGYRPYANAAPLVYLRANWLEPKVSSHNNYIDLFAHGGVLGLGLFLWLMAEIARSALHLRRRFTQGFATGYVNGMLGTWVGIMVVMLLLDWFLPFVYNVGFPGFQASVLVWLFLGGLIALDNLPPDQMVASE